jgi:hypothetical protein
LGIGGEKSGGTVGGLGLMETPLLTLNDNPITLGSIFGAFRGSAQVMEQANKTMKEIATLMEDVQKLSTEIKSYERSLQVSRMAIETVDNLKYNSNLKPSLIKKICGEYYTAIFRTPVGQEISIEHLLEVQNTAIQYDKAVQKMKSKQKELNIKTGLLNGFADQLTQAGIDDADFSKYLSDLQAFRKTSNEYDQQLKEALATPGSLSDYPTAQTLTNLQFNLAEVLSNDFTYHTRIPVYNDLVTIKLKVMEKDKTTATGEEKKAVKAREIILQAKGGLKVSASVGLNFSRHFSPGQSYSVKDDIIVEEDAGAFAPAATSFLHFYSYTGGRVSLGGSFGIGFPVVGEDENQAIQFFVGPSLIFGSRQRMVLNSGVMGGRVSRLSRGFRVGDQFDISNGDIPTRNPYELGLFIGTSFNLGGG